MRKILFPIFAFVIILGMSNCGQSEKEKYDELFDDDNPLIGTWESNDKDGDTGKPASSLIFIDDSTLHYVLGGKADVYTYEFDRTLVRFDEDSLGMVILVTREKDIIGYIYCPDDKKIYAHDLSIFYKKIKK